MCCICSGAVRVALLLDSFIRLTVIWAVCRWDGVGVAGSRR